MPSVLVELGSAAAPAPARAADSAALAGGHQAAAGGAQLKGTNLVVQVNSCSNSLNFKKHVYS